MSGRLHKLIIPVQVRDEIKAARIEATKAYDWYGEELKTSQRRWRLIWKWNKVKSCFSSN